MGSIVPCALYTPSVYEFIFTKRKGFNVSSFYWFRLYEPVRFFRVCLLIFLWLLGLIAGFWLAVNASATCHQFFVAAIATRPSKFGLLLIAVAPILLSAVGIYSDFFLINCVTVSLGSICRGFCGFLFFLFFGTGAWVLRITFMFVSTISSVLMWWMLFKYCIYGKSNILKMVCSAAIALLLFIVVDLFLISPFLFNLSIYI